MTEFDLSSLLAELEHIESLQTGIICFLGVIVGVLLLSILARQVRP